MNDKVKKQVLDFATYLDNETFLNTQPLKDEEITAYFEEWLKLSNTKNESLQTDVASWIEEWNNLFPAKTFNSAGKALRTHFKGLPIKMTQFIRNYGYTKEIIFDATIAYLKYWKSRQYAYCRASIYFIDKRDEGSDLAAYCEKVVNGEFENILTDEQVLSNNDFL